MYQYFKKSYVKVVAMILILTIAFTGSVIPIRGEVIGKEIANQNNTVDAIKILKVGKNTYHVIQGGEKEILKIKDTKKTRAVIVSDVKNKKKNSVIYNKKTKTVYSTYTKKKVKIDDVVLFSKTSYKYKYVSYARLRDLIGKFCKLGAFITAIIILSSYAWAAAPQAAAFFSAAGIAGSIIPNTNKHGLRLTIKYVKHYRRRSRVAYRTDRTLVGIKRY